jgi:hypothetical protein
MIDVENQRDGGIVGALIPTAAVGGAVAAALLFPTQFALVATVLGAAGSIASLLGIPASNATTRVSGSVASNAVLLAGLICACLGGLTI